MVEWRLKSKGMDVDEDALASNEVDEFISRNTRTEGSQCCSIYEFTNSVIYSYFSAY